MNYRTHHVLYDIMIVAMPVVTSVIEYIACWTLWQKGGLTRLAGALLVTSRATQKETTLAVTCSSMSITYIARDDQLTESTKEGESQ